MVDTVIWLNPTVYVTIHPCTSISKNCVLEEFREVTEEEGFVTACVDDMFVQAEHDKPAVMMKSKTVVTRFKADR